MVLSSISSIASGVQRGLVLAEQKRLEDSVRAGGNDFLTATFQIAQGLSVQSFATMGVEAAGLHAPTAFTWAARSVVFATPILLAALKRLSFVPEKVRHVATFLQEHLSTIYQVAAVASAIALIVFGHYFLGAAALLFLAIGFADRYGLLPSVVRQALHKFAPPLLIVTGLFFGTIPDKIFAVINFLAWCEQVSRPLRTKLLKKIRHQEDLKPSHALTPEAAIKILNGEASLVIDKNFVRYEASPEIPAIDIQTLVERFDAIDWEAKPSGGATNLQVLKTKLGGDPRFTQRYTLSEQSDEQIKTIARNTLQTFVSTIKDRRILQGEPKDYTKLHNFVKVIADRVQGSGAPNVDQTDILFRLAVEGGEYCGPGKFEAAESIYAQTIIDGGETSIETKVLYCLQDERTRWMQSYYALAFSVPGLSTMGKAYDWRDVHNYNLFMNLYGDEFGLRKEGANNDDTALVDPLSMLWIKFTVGRVIGGLFWDAHIMKDHLETLSESIGTLLLKKMDFYEFWNKWIDRQEIGEPEKQALHRELRGEREGTDEIFPPQLFGRQIKELVGDEKGIERSLIKEEFFALMLLDMGVAKIASEKDPSEDLWSAPWSDDQAALPSPVAFDAALSEERKFAVA